MNVLRIFGPLFSFFNSWSRIKWQFWSTLRLFECTLSLDLQTGPKAHGKFNRWYWTRWNAFRDQKFDPRVDFSPVINASKNKFMTSPIFFLFQNSKWFYVTNDLKWLQVFYFPPYKEFYIEYWSALDDLPLVPTRTTIIVEDL